MHLSAALSPVWLAERRMRLLFPQGTGCLPGPRVVCPERCVVCPASVPVVTLYRLPSRTAINFVAAALVGLAGEDRDWYRGLWTGVIVQFLLLPVWQ